MKHTHKTLLTTVGFALALSGNANAMMADSDNLPEIDHDFTLKMCERWDNAKRQKFDDLFQSKREKLEQRFPERVTIRWEEKWGDRDDWSQFSRSHRPFKGFHLKDHFHDFPQKEFCPPGEVTPPSAVPVPAAVWLFGSGLLSLVAVARRKQR